jgi:hypothetical protein
MLDTGCPMLDTGCLILTVENADYAEELSHEGTKARRKLTADIASPAIFQMANWSLPHTVFEIHFCDQLFGIDLGC